MDNLRRCFLFFALLFLLLPMSRPVQGLGGVTLTAPIGSNVNLDGSLGPAEWSDGTHLSFNWASNNASLNGGGNLWVKTNGTDLLVAVGADGSIVRNQGTDTYNYNLTLLFDNDNNGVVNNNEDAKSDDFTFPAAGNPVESYRDLHYDSTQQHYMNDAYVNGTASGSHVTSGAWVWEFAIPLSSSYPEDFTLPENVSIGFEIVYAEYHYSNLNLVSSGWAYWQKSYTTGLDVAPSADPWAVIVYTNLQAPISDTTKPIIGTPSITPATPGPDDKVTVWLNVTDVGSGVKNVSITYTTDSWKTNTTVLGEYNTTSYLATVLLPAQHYGGHVVYFVMAFDNAGNWQVNNNSGNYFSYDVSPPWYLNTIVFAAVGVAIATLLAALLFMRRRRKTASRPSE